MNRIDRLFENKSSGILNVYFTAGYPQLDWTGGIIKALAGAGVDLIEIGMPYSDPLADGPTIQESGQIALENGMSLSLLFEQLAEVRRETEVPMVMMGYFNQVMQYGERRFLEKCKEVGIDGLILPDLPIYEYEQYYKNWFEELDLGISFLISPQSGEERIRKIDELTRGFIYMVADAAVTGATGGISPVQLDYFERIQKMELVHPRLIGFGISDHQAFQTVSQYAQGGIIGSAFIRQLGGMSEEQYEGSIGEWVRGIKGGYPD